MSTKQNENNNQQNDRNNQQNGRNNQQNGRNNQQNGRKRFDRDQVIKDMAYNINVSTAIIEKVLQEAARYESLILNMLASRSDLRMQTGLFYQTRRAGHNLKSLFDKSMSGSISMDELAFYSELYKSVSATLEKLNDKAAGDIFAAGKKNSKKQTNAMAQRVIYGEVYKDVIETMRKFDDKVREDVPSADSKNDNGQPEGKEANSETEQSEEAGTAKPGSTSNKKTTGKVKSTTPAKDKDDDHEDMKLSEKLVSEDLTSVGE